MKRNLLFMVAFLMAATLLAIPRAEYPRPQFERQDWVNLNGDWTYTFDFVGSGMEKHLHQSQGFADKITVPFCPESKLSGVGYTDFINHIWYQRSITMPQAWSGRRVRLNFGAVYYNSEIFIDGKLAGRHFGGSTSIRFTLAMLMRLRSALFDMSPLSLWPLMRMRMYLPPRPLRRSCDPIALGAMDSWGMVLVRASANVLMPCSLISFAESTWTGVVVTPKR